MTAIYKKKGRRYVEIGVYDEESLYYPHGATLVWARPGSRLTRYGIEPANAALLAAAEKVRDAMEDAMRKASVMKPTGIDRTPLTAKQKKAWAAYTAIAGDRSSLWLEGASLHDVVDAGIKTLIDAAAKGVA